MARGIERTYTEAELEQIREAQREYLREWRRKNPDRVREYTRRRFLKLAQRRRGEVDSNE